MEIISSTFIDKDEVLEDLRTIPQGYLNSLAPLLEYIKADMVAKGFRILDNINYAYYLNGAVGFCDVLQKYMGTYGKIDNIAHSSITGKLKSTTKPGNANKTRIRKT